MNARRGKLPVAAKRRIAIWCMACLLGLYACASAPTSIAAAQPSTSDFAFSEPYFETVGDSDTIPFGVVTAQAQDAKGLLWIGTQNGLVSYDGYRFNKYVHAADDPGSLAGDYINFLWAAPDGRLWIGTNGSGLSIFDPKTNLFESLPPRFPHPPAV